MNTPHEVKPRVVKGGKLVAITMVILVIATIIGMWFMFDRSDGKPKVRSNAPAQQIPTQQARPADALPPAGP